MQFFLSCLILHESKAALAGQVAGAQEVLERLLQAAGAGGTVVEHLGGEVEGGTVLLGPPQDVGSQHSQPVSHFLLG